jgi:hypothetical protein
LAGVAPRDEPQVAEPPVTVAARLDPSRFAGPFQEPKIDVDGLNQVVFIDAAQKRVQKDDPSTYVLHQTISDVVASLANEAQSITFVADA